MASSESELNSQHDSTCTTKEDVIVCGICHRSFNLSEISQFIQHKRCGCSSDLDFGELKSLLSQGLRSIESKL